MEDRDLQKLTSRLVCLQPGLWGSEAMGTPLSFPDQGHAECYQVEEGSFWFRHRNSCITTILARYPPAGTLFDVGGGNGYVSLAIKKSGYDAVLVEPAIEGARFGLERGLHPVVCSTVRDAGFTAGSLPAVGLFDVLEHVREDREFLLDLHRLLVKDGRLYLTVPAYQWLWSSEDESAGHFRRYRIGDVRELLQQVGFRVEFETYIFSVLPLPILVMRRMAGQLGSKPTTERHRREHNPSVLSSVVDWTLSSELALLRNGRRLPFGSSCLVVATPNQA